MARREDTYCQACSLAATGITVFSRRVRIPSLGVCQYILSILALLGFSRDSDSAMKPQVIETAAPVGRGLVELEEALLFQAELMSLQVLFWVKHILVEE